MRKGQGGHARSHNNHSIQNPSGVLLDWHPRAEAVGMYGLFKSGGASLSDCMGTMRMTIAEKEDLVEKRYCTANVAIQLYQARFECLQMFKRLVRGELLPVKGHR